MQDLIRCWYPNGQKQGEKSDHSDHWETEKNIFFSMYLLVGLFKQILSTAAAHLGLFFLNISLTFEYIVSLVCLATKIRCWLQKTKNLKKSKNQRKPYWPYSVSNPNTPSASPR